MSLALEVPGSRELVPYRVERLNPLVGWKKFWMAASLPVVSSKISSSQLKMLFDILPTRERMQRMNLSDVPSAVCMLQKTFCQLFNTKI